MTGTTVAAFEPALDYIVVKLPRFPFDKFPTADRTLGSQMKATGEVMAIDRTFGSALNKALRGLEQAGAGRSPRTRAGRPTFDYLAAVYGGGEPTRRTSRSAGSTSAGQACESTRFAQRLRGADRPAPVPRAVRQPAVAAPRPAPPRRPGAVIVEATGISPWFVAEMARNVAGSRGRRPRPVSAHRGPSDPGRPLLATAKRAGFGDRELAGLAGVDAGGDPRGAAGPRSAPRLRDGRHLCRGVRGRDPVLLLDLRRGRIGAGGAAGGRGRRPSSSAAGPVRIGQGIEFDYCAVQAADTLGARRLAGRDDQLEPRDRVDRLRCLVAAVLRAARPGSVRSVIDAESPPASLPAVVAFGGQTPLNLAGPLAAGGVDLLGSDLEAIDQAEERTRFAALLDRLGIPQPEGGMAHSIEEALTLAERISYPVIVRPSFVIGGLAIDFCYSPEDLLRQLAAATVVDPDRPVRIDRYLEGVEVDVDAVSDGERVLIPGLLEHVERAGVHSGDSVGLFPPQTVSEGDQALIVATMERIVLALGAKGLVNAQFIVRDDGVYLIEVNPRASRTVPFLSKVTGVPMVELAVRIALGATLPELGWLGGHLPPPPFVAVKAPAFSTAKLRGVDPSVGPGMQSTGEVIGIHTDPSVAMAKALLGAALVPPRAGDEGALALLSIADRDKELLPRLATALKAAGYALAATPEPARRWGEPGSMPDPSPSSARRRQETRSRSSTSSPRATSGSSSTRRPHAPRWSGPRRRRDPAGRHRGGDPLPDRDRDRGRGRGGARPAHRHAPVRGSLARRVGPGRAARIPVTA